MKGLLLFVVFLVILTFEVQAEKIKFKAITKKELHIDKCEFYPEAKAMILDKRGEIDFDWSTDGLVYRYSEGVRIKILDDQVKDVGDVKIVLYSPENNLKGPREKVTFLNGWTYTLENGEIVKTKLEKSNVYNNRLNEYWVEVSFAMPNVKKGAVVEYSYLKESSYITNLAPWHFQDDIPTCSNELTYTIPEYFDFQSRMMGNMYKMDRSEKWVNDVISGVTFRSKRIEMKVKDVPPVEDEPFISNYCDLPMRLEFQLVTVDIPTQPILRVAGSYTSFNKQLLEMDRFWRAATKGSFPKEVSAAVAGMNDEEKISYLLNWMKEAIAWTGEYGIVQSKPLRESLNKKSGSVADINLALTSLLRQNGLEAYPVILSCRGNGVIHPIYPNFDDFNYVVVAVNLGDACCFCDATSKAPAGLLPIHCLNGSGWLVSEQGGQMIPLKVDGANVSSVISTVEIKDGTIKTSFGILDKEYAALHEIDEYLQQGAKKFEEGLRARYTDWNFSDFGFEPGARGVKKRFALEKPCGQADVLYIQPFLYGLASEPLFKRDSRSSVVDFPCGIQQTIATTITIPEGYEIEELPQAVAYLLSNKGALFTFNALGSADKVTISLTFTLKKLVYAPGEYPELKDFFEHLAELSKTVIILKKKQV